MEGGGHEAQQATESRQQWLRRSVRGAAFWAAILLPLSYLVVLVVGLESPRRVALFAALVGCHLLALAVGHAYGR